jgi:hypothetical protein
MRELINLFEAPDPETIAALGKVGYKTKIDGNTIVVMVQVPEKNKNAHRKDVLNKIQEFLSSAMPAAGAHIISDPKLSSVGVIAFKSNPTKIVVKDMGIQGDRSAGIENEIGIAKMIQSVIEKFGPANVSFVDSRGKKLIINSVERVELSGKQVKDKETGQSKKADVVLYSKTEKLPISIKKLDAESWESADSSFGQRAREIIDDLVEKNIVELIPLGDENFKLSKEIVVEPTKEEAIRAIFGGDLNPQGGIVVQTFKPDHFTQVENNITIDCHAVIKTAEDIPESHLMVWLIRNQSGRLSKKLGIRGLRPMGSTLHRAIGARGDKDVILVDKNGNVVQRAIPATKQTKEPEIPPPLKPVTVTRVPRGKSADIGREKR